MKKEKTKGRGRVVSMYQGKKEQAVTLIALVVTLVILIILAAVSINMVLGDQGIFKKARKGANSMHDAEVNTQIAFNSITAEVDRVIQGEVTTPEEKSEIEQAKDSGEVFDTKTPLEDEHGNIIQIPAGFKVASNSGDTVQQGIVIEDVSASGDEKVKGSQFVWIPVGTFKKDNGDISKEIILGRYTFENSELKGKPTLVQAAYTDDEPENYLKYGESEIIDSYYIEYPQYREGVASRDSEGVNTTAKDLAGFVNSVKTNGGYYIARYEASYASGMSIDDYKAASKVSTKYSEDNMNYEEGTLWNYINQLDASKVAINTYSESDSVISDLINSYAWDTAIVYIQEAGNEDYANKTSVNSELADTGKIGDEVCKIHDMASNLWEWTTEYSNEIPDIAANPSTNRGGCCNYKDTNTAFRDNYYSGDFTKNVTFRIILYINS